MEKEKSSPYTFFILRYRLVNLQGGIFAFEKEKNYGRRKTASELITGIEEVLRELQLKREMEQEQSKECILLIQNEDLTEFSLVNVRGMDTQELLAALFDHDLSVYLLHNDGSETTVEDRKQITEHEGIFGIEKGDWENERKLRFMQAELSDNEINKEAQLLYSSSDKYGIYQLKHNPELDHLRFEGTESLKRMGITKDNFDAIKPDNYELIYVGELSELQEQTEGETLEAIYEKFNIDHPEDYRGHSLSVSDIVVLHQNGENSAHFVDSFGFTGIPDFMQTLEGVKEQEAEIDTSGQDVHKSELEKQEKETSDNTLEDGDEIIDLGDEKEQVLADMKKSLEIGEKTELAFQIADRYISVQEVDGGYDHSIMRADYKEIDGGVYDNPDVTIREALTDIIDDLKAAPDHNGAKGSIKEKDELHE